jgi:putative endopeptidase
MSRTARPAALRRRLQSCAVAAVAIAAFAPLCLAAGANEHGLDFAGMDPSVAPGDDFFRHANGRWLATTEIPPDRSSWGIDEQLAELTLQRTVELIRAADASAAPGTEARKIGDYYASYMDDKRIEQLGLKPLEPLLKDIDAIGDRAARHSVRTSTS